MTALPPDQKRNQGTDAPSADAATSLSASLLSVSHSIAGASDERSLIDAFSSVMEACGVDAYTLSRTSGEPGASTKIVAAWDRSGEPAVRVGDRVPRAGRRAIEELAPDRPGIVDDGASAPRLDEGIKGAAEATGVRSLNRYPLVHRDEVIGALEVIHRTEHSHMPDEGQLFSTLAQLASVALLNADCRTQIEAQVHQLNAFYRIGAALSEMTNEDSILETAASMLVSEGGYLNAWIATVDEGANQLRERTLGGLGAVPGRLPGVYSLDNHNIMPVEALHLGQPLVYDDIQRRADAEGWGDVARTAGMLSAGYVPLRAGGKVFGVLSIGSTAERISDGELSLLGAFGNQLASTLSRVQMNREREKQLIALEEAYANMVRLLETVRELSTPVIPVHDGVLVLPLVGTIDSLRSAQVMDSLLTAIQKDRASVVIIDITGVPVVDTGVADHLLRSTRAAALLGAKCVLVGVAPAVAQTLVQLGVDLGDLVIRSNLQAGISYALERLGRGAARR